MHKEQEDRTAGLTQSLEQAQAKLAKCKKDCKQYGEMKINRKIHTT
jgi:hypothetical protein